MDSEKKLKNLERKQKEQKKIEEKTEEDKKNPPFTQFYNQNMKHLRNLAVKDGLAMGIFLFLTEHMDTNNAVACSSKILEEYFEKSRTSVYRSIKTLLDGGYIGASKMGNINIYHMNQKIVWKSWNNMKRYSEFQGKMLIAESEQYNKEDKIKKTKKKTNILVSTKETE